jgi:predicted transcriptional regulator of viral defense system
LPAFNLNDIRKFDPGFHRQQLTDWLDRGYIQSLVGGFYALPETQVDEGFLFMLANRVYTPSYISNESALAYYLVIPETVLGVNSATSRKTRRLDSRWGSFYYSSLKPSLMFGYRVVKHDQNVQFTMASLEKAVLDYLYWNTSIDSVEDFEGLRWNQQELSGLVDHALFREYMKVFNNKTLEHRIDLLLEYIHA